MTDARPAGTAELPRKRTVLLDLKGLTRVGARPTLTDYLVSLWSYRHFVLYDAKARVQSANRRDRLGSAWLLLDPLLNGLGYLIIFGLLLDSSRGIENFLGYLIIGIFLFQLSTRSIVSTSRIISSNQNVIQAFNFPRATLALAVNIREFIANIPVILMMLMLIIAMPPVEKITWLWVLILPVIVFQVIFNLGLGLLLAPMVAKVNDLVHVISFLMRFWMFASCVMFSITRYEQWPVILRIVEGNPMYIIITMVRDCLLYAQAPRWQDWAALLAWSLGSLCVGIFFFWRGEETYGRDE
ncbi:ABC transporter permease [Arthrobacter gengyunqii]|uniref:Transport permease protein n=1 Tax=Arthrobacter gengyunqii TaxID=2886940 RepID=A0A9X1S8D0_9MICC|nr:ABC transporter permease [Arthrobacter gengyunqii]MCC3269909.1 ABC transporter permease [Arthrobacter gengyunqii]UOY95160.1 ABC transporter permease [Arthrobacter gengyunqii]